MAKRPVNHGPADVVVDHDGLWTGAGGSGPGVLRSVPGPGGVQRLRLWPVPVDAGLPAWVADALHDGAPVRLRALAHLIAATLAAADEACVAEPFEGRWRWRAAPGPAGAKAVQDAIEVCVRAGVAGTADPQRSLRDLSDRLADAHLALATSEIPDLPPPAQQAPWRRWAQQVVTRSAANARLAVVVNPPAETDVSPGWSLQALAIRLDEPTTRLPWESAGPEMFDATATGWEDFRDTEVVALRRAWGRPVAFVLDDVLRSRTDLADPDVLVFLDRVAGNLQDAGFDVIAPGGLLHTAGVRRRMTRSEAGTGTLSVDGLGLAAQVLVDGQTLTAAELQALAAAKSELVAVSGRWLRISAADVTRLSALARRLRRPVTAADLLADEAFEGVELEAGAVLRHGLSPAREVAAPDVRATLRPYQLAGLRWLTWLADNGVGGVLADDMGLGKTLQVLSWIQADHAGPTLVVCPVTLVDTWARQAEQFTPQVRVQTFHGAERAVLDTRADLVVTTYGLLARDERLQDATWHRVVLDEAQAIKNPDTRAARAARNLRATHRLAVTGTPVENHLGDLWSLFAFAQPGLLPRRKAFQQRYSNGSPTDLQRLRAVVSPFILRRVKTDPGILPDLPDREIIRDDCVMTREQVGAYEAVVTDLLGALEQLRAAAGSAAEPALRRRATVLGSIARLKQICVHPALLTESRRNLGDRSGKVSRLVDLCTQIVEEGQAVVVFTQFASFVPDLAAHLQKSLGVPVATLTGSDSRAARAKTVAAFSEPDGPPILIASLKAGGTGLTLVRANHVVHLDRWWNPAVEDQASDRVWRIGQNQKVTVHVLVCPGTLEDRIDAALRSKRRLAASVITSTDTAVTELSDGELQALVELVRDEVLQ